MIKTNAVRVLDRLAINYELREYCERSVFFALMVRNLLTKSAIRERVVFATSCFIREPPMTVLLRSGVLLSRSAAMNSGPMWGITKSSGWWQKHGADVFIPGGSKEAPSGTEPQGKRKASNQSSRNACGINRLAACSVRRARKLSGSDLRNKKECSWRYHAELRPAQSHTFRQISISLK